MVSLDRVDNRVALLILAGDINADLNVAAFDLVIERLTDIMQQTCSLAHGRIKTELRSDHTGDITNLEGMHQHILTVAGTVFQTTEDLDELGMQTVYAGVEHRTFTCLLDACLDLSASLLDHFLYPRGMDTAVGDELFERDASDLAANGLKAG